MRLSANRIQAISKKVDISVPFSEVPCFCLNLLKSLPVPHTLSNLFCKKIAYQPYHVGGPSEYVVSVSRNQTATLYINLGNSDKLVGFESTQHSLFRISKSVLLKCYSQTNFLVANRLFTELIFLQ